MMICKLGFDPVQGNGLIVCSCWIGSPIESFYRRPYVEPFFQIATWILVSAICDLDVALYVLILLFPSISCLL